MPRKKASLSILHLDILQEIIYLCDEKSLLALGKVNSVFNYMALKEILKRGNITNPDHSSIPSDTFKELFPALCAALWVRRISYLAIFLRGDIRSLFNGVRRVMMLIHRLDFVGRLTVYLGGVIGGFSGGYNNVSSSTIQPTSFLIQLFVSLLEVLSRKGCTHMEISGGETLWELYPPALASRPQRYTIDGRTVSCGPTRVRTRSEVRRALIQRTMSPPMEDNSNPQPGSTSYQNALPCIQTLDLHSSIFLHTDFLPHFICFIRHHAPVLDKLAFSMHNVSEEIWGKLFHSVTLPVLKTFSYRYHWSSNEKATLTPRILLNFLARHPSIESFDLAGASMPARFPRIGPTILFPRLKRINVHPRIASWLLQVPNRCPELKQVTLTPESDCFHMPDPYQDFDDAISVVASFTRLLNLELTFTTQNTLLEWLQQHVDPQTESVLRKLTHLKFLSVFCDHHTETLPEYLDVLPRWVALIPNLEIFSLTLPSASRDEHEEFRDAMLKTNPGLGHSWIMPYREILFGQTTRKPSYF